MSQSRRNYGKAANDEYRRGHGRAAYDRDGKGRERDRHPHNVYDSDRSYGRSAGNGERRPAHAIDRVSYGRAMEEAGRRSYGKTMEEAGRRSYGRTMEEAGRRSYGRTMEETGRSYGRAAQDTDRRSQGTDSRSEYVYGNTVRKIAPQEQWEQEPEKKLPAKKPHPVVRKNREKARRMSAGYVMFLAAALCASAYILVNFIQLQSDLTNLTKIVADKESELNGLRLANDEDYNRIISGIDLEEIKRIAIGELGMSYAQEGQIIKYENEEGDYMRRVTESN